MSDKFESTDLWNQLICDITPKKLEKVHCETAIINQFFISQHYKSIAYHQRWDPAEQSRRGCIEMAVGNFQDLFGHHAV